MNWTSTRHAPHAFRPRIVRDKRTLNIIYQIIEPPMTKKGKGATRRIMDIFIRSLQSNIEEIDTQPEAYLRAAMDKVIKSYGMKISKKSKSKIFYYIRRDLVGDGKMDVLMNDVKVEDISLDGTGVPIFAYHRKFESVETTCVWNTDDELESYVIKLAQRCGKHISVADPCSTRRDGRLPYWMKPAAGVHPRPSFVSGASKTTPFRRPTSWLSAPCPP
ncbi:MAG: hypothetical protein CM15mP128_4510 [Methanobacteriota archaeon]|nr:MAG: hypothetical protein CM15mP128_4510 [Euryarchaeota archaeon]